MKLRSILANCSTLLCPLVVAAATGCTAEVLIGEMEGWAQTS